MQYKNDSRSEEFSTPPLKTEEHEAALTPTDVHDVHIWNLLQKNISLQKENKKQWIYV